MDGLLKKDLMELTRLVWRLQRGTSLKLLSLEMNVTAARLSDWSDRIEHAVETALKERTGDDEISHVTAPSRLRPWSLSARA